jgi:two-component system cell cycle sensor histidine kinase/response regulator CckA
MNRIGSPGTWGIASDAGGRARGGGAFGALVGLVVAGGVGLFALLSLRASEPVGLTVLAGLAAVGIFSLFAFAARIVRIGHVDTSGELYRSLFDTIDQGVLIAEADGRAVYANRAYETMVGVNALGEYNALEVILAGEKPASEALFRLARAGERGERHVEEVQLSRGGEALSYRLSVGPVARELQPEGGPGYILWQIHDLSAVRREQAQALRAVGERLDRHDSLGLGLFTCRRDGGVGFINQRLADWLHLPAGSARRVLMLSDIVSEDAVALITSLFNGEDERPERIDLDLIREDGTRWPASLSIARHGEELVAGVIERVADSQNGLFESAHGRFGRFFQTAPFGIALVGVDGVIESANGAFGRLLLTAGSARGSQALEVLTRGAGRDARDAVEQAMQAALAGKANIPPVEIAVGADGQFTRQIYLTSVGRGRSAKGGVVIYVIDATEQKALEVKYAQSQKMEGVGKLAGGIAHDFNNVLTVIIGFSDLLLATHRPGDPAYKNIASIKSSANRAARMVKQLLAFSRRQTLQPEVLDVGECLSDISVLLNRLLGERIDLAIQPGRSVWSVKADRTQLEQVVFNLAANARDAMPDGGKLTIRTRNVTERESRKFESLAVVRGQYVAIEVVDTGSGMSSAVLEQIFEPFFTTKAIGKGTGLGLATVYGIVKQTGGYIFAESEVGKGTTFRILLPRSHEVRADTEDEIVAAKLPEGGDLTGVGRVLIVEDEDGVRTFAVEALKRKGYDVVEACDGLEALDILKEADYAFDIVVSDVMMPEMDGPTLLNEVVKVKPELKFIFVSGYADDAFARSLDPAADFSFVAKPYTLAQIAAEVKRRLGR